MSTEQRLLICVVLSLLVAMVFSWYRVPPKPGGRSLTADSQTVRPTPTSSAAQVTPKPTTDGSPTKTDEVSEPDELSGWNWIPTEAPEGDAEEILVSSELYRIRFSTHGAVPLSWELMNYEELFADPQYLKLVAGQDFNPLHQLAQYELDLYERAKDNGFTPIQAIDPTMGTDRSGFVIRWGPNRSDRNVAYQTSKNHYHITEPADVRFTYAKNDITIEKTFRFYPDSYHVDLEIRLLNQTGQTIEIPSSEGYYDLDWWGGFGSPSFRRDTKNQTHFTLTGSHKMALATGLESELRKSTSLLDSYHDRAMLVTSERVDWVGVGEKYFLAGLVPIGKTGQAIKGYSLPDWSMVHVQKPIVGIRMPLRELMNDIPHRDQFTLYVGPMMEDYLSKAGAGLEDAQQIFLRWFTGPIVHLMLKLLNGLYALVPNYGIAIIVLTITIKLLMFPLYQKQMTQMKKMQALQPHINDLKEKYKDDPQKMQKEQMELFRKHKVNPLGGCLPMLPTIPVFIALYATFGMSVELRGAPFLMWIHDLSAPDQAFFIPIAGHIIPMNILPLAYAVLMFANTSMQKVEGPNANMMRFFPLIFVFIFWSIASGVILYFVVSIFIDLTQRFLMDRLQKRESKPEPVGTG